MNKCIFVGNLTKDIELQKASEDVAFCRFNIAVNRPYRTADGEREADFITIVAWRTLAEQCAKYLSKGKKVCVCGSLQSRSYDDKDGNKRYVSEIVAEDVEFISPFSTSEEDIPLPEPPPEKENYNPDTTAEEPKKAGKKKQ